MKSFVKNVFDTVFNFGTGLIIFCGVMLFLALIIASKDADASAACVKAGMIQISYDGNRYCVAPANLNLVSEK